MNCPKCGEEIKSYCEDKDQVYVDMLTDNTFPFVVLVLLGGLVAVWVCTKVVGWVL